MRDAAVAERPFCDVCVEIVWVIRYAENPTLSQSRLLLVMSGDTLIPSDKLLLLISTALDLPKSICVHLHYFYTIYFDSGRSALEFGNLGPRLLG